MHNSKRISGKMLTHELTYTLLDMKCRSWMIFLHHKCRDFRETLYKWKILSHLVRLLKLDLFFAETHKTQQTHQLTSTTSNCHLRKICQFHHIIREASGFTSSKLGSQTPKGKSSCCSIVIIYIQVSNSVIFFYIIFFFVMSPQSSYIDSRIGRSPPIERCRHLILLVSSQLGSRGKKLLLFFIHYSYTSL